MPGMADMVYVTGRNRVTHRMTVKPGIAEKIAPIKTPRLIQIIFSRVKSSPIAGPTYSIIFPPPP